MRDPLIPGEIYEIHGIQENLSEAKLNGALVRYLDSIHGVWVELLPEYRHLHYLSRFFVTATTLRPPPEQSQKTMGDET